MEMAPTDGPLGSASMRRTMRDALAGFARLRLAVVGDLMLDRYHFGFTSRVSREAPVVVLHHDHTREVPGGAANTAANARALGADVTVLGVVGADNTATRLRQAFAEAGIPAARQRLHVAAAWPTTCKVRILGGLQHATMQQLVRLDYEQPLPAGTRHEAAAALAAALREVWHELDACILSDYGLGVAAEPALMAAVRELHAGRPIPVAVDARRLDDRYRGLTAATPNVAELEETLADPRLAQEPGRLAQQAARLREALGLAALLVTRGRFGMALFEAGRPEPLWLPVFGGNEVADVTGAGDTVIAVYTAALAAGAAPEAAARLANVAGGLVVMKRGTATVAPADLLRALDGDGDGEGEGTT